MLKILYVDDDERDRDHVKNALEKEGYEVVTLKSLRDLETMNLDNFSLIILDGNVDTPGSNDGFTEGERLFKRNHKIFILSNYIEPGKWKVPCLCKSGSNEKLVNFVRDKLNQTV